MVEARILLPEDIARLNFNHFKRQQEIESEKDKGSGRFFKRILEERRAFRAKDQLRLSTGQSVRLREIGLSPRPYQSSIREGIVTVMGLEQFLAQGKIPVYVGIKSFDEIDVKLKRFREKTGWVSPFTVYLPDGVSDRDWLRENIKPQLWNG
jgi:hypothetical protein